MLDELKRFEEVSRQLESSPEEVAAWLQDIQKYSSDFLKWLPESQVRNFYPDSSSLREGVPTSPSDFKSLLEVLDKKVLKDGLNASSGRYMAFVPPGGLASAAAADFLAALTNRYSGNYMACPGAVEIENVTVRWLRELVGFPESAWGTLHSGGTLSALAAVVVARDTRPSSRWGKGVVYLTSQSHHSLTKMLHTAGLGDITKREIAVDDQYRMSLPALEKQIADDKAQGLEPWILFASAGTTNSGAVDDLQAMFSLSRTHGLWLHVDAAYGGFFALTKPGARLFKAMGEADSIVLDPHKGLFLPYGCGAVLIRDGRKLESSFSSHPVYLADLSQETVPSPGDFSPEGTRHFRALRLWLSLKLHGVERFKAALEEKLLLAQWAYGEIAKDGRFEMGPKPQLSVVLFRVKGESDKPTEDLLAKIQKSNRIVCSSTRLGERLYVRFCILNFRTHLEDVRCAVDEVTLPN